MNGVRTGAADERQPFRWVIFGAMCAVCFAFGVILLAIPPMVDEVRADLGASRGAIGLALVAMAILLVLMIAVLARDDARRVGRRTEMATAALAAAARKNTMRSH